MLLSGDNSKDIDGEELFMEVKFFRNIIPKDVVHVGEILNYLMKNNMSETFPNIKIIYKILLTFTVTVASGERSFSKLKLIKTYIRATMSQQRLCGLATISIEREEASMLDYEELINIFATQKSRKISFM